MHISGDRSKLDSEASFGSSIEALNSVDTVPLSPVMLRMATSAIALHAYDSCRSAACPLAQCHLRYDVTLQCQLRSLHQMNKRDESRQNLPRWCCSRPPSSCRLMLFVVRSISQRTRSGSNGRLQVLPHVR